MKTQLFLRPKLKHPGAKEKFLQKNIGKFDSQPSRNREIKCFKCLGTRYIASQFPNKHTMILREDREVETKEEADEESKQSLGEENEGVEYPVVGDLQQGEL